MENNTKATTVMVNNSSNEIAKVMEFGMITMRLILRLSI